eukprot:scaffold283137_cov66-Attheya_sp.AAC.2
MITGALGGHHSCTCCLPFWGAGGAFSSFGGVRSARAQRMRSACSWCRSVIVYRSGRLLCGGGGECRCVACVSVCAV